MANFFKGYGPQAYQKKHKGEQIEEIKTSNLTGYEAPNPKSLGNHKRSTKSRDYDSTFSDEKNNN